MPDRLRLIHAEDRDVRPLGAALTPRFAVETVAVTALDGVGDLAEPATLVDVDLSDPVTIRHLRDRLPRRGTAPRLIAVEPGRRSERIQASILGASAILRRPLDPERVWAELIGATGAGRLDVALGRGSVPDGAPGRASILVAETALADLFSACSGDGAATPGLVEAAGAEVTRSIGEVGFEGWMETVRRHHGGTYQHCLLTAGIAVGFGSRLGMTPSDVERLARAALVHDVGKARVPVALLDKPGALSEAEQAVVRCHPEWGWAFLRQSDPRTDPVILDAVLHHHEALDGSGYPHGLCGAAIADPTRVLTICDVYGALAERRAYRPPMETAEILTVLYRMVAEGKVERALVRALDWIVSGARPAGVVAGWTPRRLAVGLTFRRERTLR